MCTKEIEETLRFTPVFDEKGLIPCITTCAQSGDVLMFAFMDEQAILQTIRSGEAHYWSRSKKKLWHKGAESGFTQKVVDMRTDCDQDCIWLKVEVRVPADARAPATCHTGRKSCFYRQIHTGLNDTLESEMNFIDAEQVFDPDDVYG